MAIICFEFTYDSAEIVRFNGRISDHVSLKTHQVDKGLTDNDNVLQSRAFIQANPAHEIRDDTPCIDGSKD